MVDTMQIRNLIHQKGYEEKEIAAKLGISEKAFQNRLNEKRFLISEVEKLISILEIKNPAAIFFTK